jgi:hypothetical protein
MNTQETIGLIGKISSGWCNMAYKYFGFNDDDSFAPKNQFVDAFQALLDQQFDVSTTYFTIQEEVNFGSNVFFDVDVRINRAINSLTGQKLGDDFKQILFRDLGHATGVGYKYFFDDNYWIVVFSENIKNLAASCMVRRCNDMLRWFDDSGVYHEEPCSIDYKISRPRDSIGTVNPPILQGFLDVFTQLNDRTEKIYGNQRFLFGRPNNRVCLKVFGNGVNNLQGQETLSDTSGRLLTLSMGGNFINPDTDDIVNGIADRYVNYNNFVSASTVGVYSIISTPDDSNIIESGSAVYNVKYYLGTVPQSGSFIFNVIGTSVPQANYTLNVIDGNNFSIVNNQKWLANTLDIGCVGANGSRVLNIYLKGAW